MAIIIKTNAPHSLVAEIKKTIDDGTIDTWSYDEDGDFTHVGQWMNKAWFTPIYDIDRLTFGILGRKAVLMTRMEYSVYHGRFVEMLLNHFPQYASNILITAPLVNDKDTNNIEM